MGRPACDQQKVVQAGTSGRIGLNRFLRLFIFGKELKMRGLKICLWISGIMWLLSLVGVFLPLSVIESFHSKMGLDSFPDSVLFLYGLRVMSAIAGGVGVFYIILALDPLRYGVMVPFSAVSSIVLGILCGVVGIRVKMPLLWFLGDALGCFVIGILILYFWQQSSKTLNTNE
jgi:hypothetical protein